jgi:hypothetical protein
MVVQFRIDDYSLGGLWMKIAGFSNSHNILSLFQVYYLVCVSIQVVLMHSIIFVLVQINPSFNTDRGHIIFLKQML